MKKKHFIATAGILIVVVAALVVYGLASADIMRSSTQFGFAPEETPQCITLQDSIHSTLLTLESTGWMLPNNQPAHPDRTEEALALLSMLQVRVPLPPEYLPILNTCPQVHITVGCGSRSKRAYTLYFLPQDKLAGRVDGKHTTYLLEVQGTPQALFREIFNSNPLAWQPTLFLQIIPANIKEVSVHKLQTPTFHMRVLNLDTLVQVFDGSTNKPIPHINQSKIRRYLSFFHQLQVERYATVLTPDQEQTILQANPAYQLTITDKHGLCTTLHLFDIPLPPGSTDEFGRPSLIDRNHCYLQINNSPHLAIARWIDFDLLLMSYQHFVN